ncbi:MAG TPA: protoporphyrinogen oxidase HemJ [Candidatus Tenderia sp.]|nr:protoporphyrinogen oxidase HemJ [Candidatus Tenderia sp.]
MWVKAFHVIFMVTWFAGLFYLPRLFVYHAVIDADDSPGNERMKVMERKLYAIMTIGAVLTVVFGLWLLVDYAWAAFSGDGWLHAKLFLVAVLIGYHLHCGKIVKEFRADQNQRSHVFYRWFNEFPVLILFGVVILVIVKPF